jgi:hypothetical protein
MQGSAKKQADEPLTTLLKINSQYGQLLQQLAQNNNRSA